MTQEEILRMILAHSHICKLYAYMVFFCIIYSLNSPNTHFYFWYFLIPKLHVRRMMNERTFSDGVHTSGSRTTLIIIISTTVYLHNVHYVYILYNCIYVTCTWALDTNRIRKYPISSTSFKSNLDSRLFVHVFFLLMLHSSWLVISFDMPR